MPRKYQKTREDIPVYPFFVYGTLRNGCGNYYGLLAGKTEQELRATAQGILYHMGGLPVAFQGNETIVGDLMFIRPRIYQNVARQLDRLEGFIDEDSRYNFYNRKLIDVMLENGEEQQAWIYFYNNNDISKRRIVKIKDGDFVAWRQRMSAIDGY